MVRNIKFIGLISKKHYIYKIKDAMIFFIKYNPVSVFIF